MKGKSESVREFSVPLDLSEADRKTCDHFIKIFDRGAAEQFCSMREKVEGLAAKLGCTKNEDGESEADFKERNT